MSSANRAVLRVVLDTNVYFSAFTGQGVPFTIWQKAIKGDYILLTSPAIIREVAQVFREKLNWSEDNIIGYLKLLVKTAQIINPDIILKVINEDESDNRILECAVLGNADLIVSGDHHLRRLKNFRHIGIIRPIDFMRMLSL